MNRSVSAPDWICALADSQSTKPPHSTLYQAALLMWVGTTNIPLERRAAAQKILDEADQAVLERIK